MELVIGLIVLAAILYLLFSGRGKKGASTKPVSVQKSSSMSKEERVLQDNSGWMELRWKTAEKERDGGELKSVPKWFFDDVTEYQLKKIAEIGLNIKSGHLTKGQASDIIGLFEPAEDEQREILNFFKIPLKGMNQSRARYEVGKIFQDPEKVESWKNRPASAIQKEFYKFFNLKVPQGVTYEAALKYIDEYKGKLSGEDRLKVDEWDSYENLYEEINDPDFREDYDLKKISLTVFRSAIKQLKDEGKTLAELSGDSDMVVDKIIELKPDIEKA